MLSDTTFVNPVYVKHSETSFTMEEQTEEEFNAEKEERLRLWKEHKADLEQQIWSLSVDYYRSVVMVGGAYNDKPLEIKVPTGIEEQQLFVQTNIILPFKRLVESGQSGLEHDGKQYIDHAQLRDKPNYLQLNKPFYENGIYNHHKNNVKVDENAFILDLETTDAKAGTCGIVSMSIIVLGTGGARQDYTWKRIKPYTMISEEAYKIHGISNRDVAGCVTFKDIALHVYKITNGLRPIGYNIDKFDLPILNRHLVDAGFSKMSWLPSIDLYVINIALNGKTLSNMYKQYCHEDISHLLHDAHSDCLAVQNILFSLHKQHPCLPKTLAGLSEWQNTVGRPSWMKAPGSTVATQNKKRKQGNSITNYFSK